MWTLLQASAPPGLKRAAILFAAGFIGTALIVAMAWYLACGDCRRDTPNVAVAAAPSSIHPPQELTQRRAASPDAAALPASAARTTAYLEQALFVKGSLRGTAPPPWGVGRDEPLKPNRALRDRFDYYLLAMGEASLEELTALVREHADRDLGLRTSGEVMQLWARYLQLQQHAFAVVARPEDAMSMQAALQERHQIRQGILGAHWAEAFYGDEEQQLATDIDHKIKGVKIEADGPPALMMAPAPGTDPRQVMQQRSAKFGAEAAQRLAELDREESEWTRRIEAAKAKVQSLKAAPELSGPQRDTAISQYLNEAFPNASDRLRAGGLVGE